MSIISTELQKKALSLGNTLIDRFSDILVGLRITEDNHQDENGDYYIEFYVALQLKEVKNVPVLYELLSSEGLEVYTSYIANELLVTVGRVWE